MVEMLQRQRLRHLAEVCSEEVPRQRRLSQQRHLAEVCSEEEVPQQRQLSQQPQVGVVDYLEVVHLQQLIPSQLEQEAFSVVEMPRRQRPLQQLEVSLVEAAQQVVEEGYLGAVHLRQLIQSQRRRSQHQRLQEVCLVVEMPRRQRPLLQLEVSLVVVAQLPL